MSVEQSAPATSIKDVPWSVLCRGLDNKLDRASLAAAILGEKAVWNTQAPIALARRGDDVAMRWLMLKLRNQRPDFKDLRDDWEWEEIITRACDIACDNGHVLCMRIALNHREYSGFGGHARFLVRLALRAVRSEQIFCLTSLFEWGCPHDKEITAEAIACGSVKSLVACYMKGGIRFSDKDVKRFMRTQLYADFCEALAAARLPPLRLREGRQN